jgi:LytS/YehU family sensor histidine kinase
MTFLTWLTNIVILESVRKSWAKSWIRIIISTTMIILSGNILIYFFNITKFPNQIPYFQFTVFRLNNIISLNLIIFILLDLIFSRETKLQLNKENAELKFSNLEAEYKLLKEQVNPHFLFNALNISKSLIKTQPEEAEKYIIQLSEFLRATINQHQKSNALCEELALCKIFIELQKVRFGDSLKVSIDVDETKSQFHLPFFGLVTLIENTIKHNSFSGKKPLHINIFTENEYVNVKNNLQPKIVFYSSNTGLSNLNHRSKLLSNNEIEIIKDENNFCVKIKMIRG